MVHISWPYRMEVTRDLCNLNLLAKLMVLQSHSLFSLAIAEAILMWTSAAQVPSLAQGCSKVLETGYLLLLLAVYADICTDVVRTVNPDLALFCADFHFICCCSVYESVEVKFTIAAATKIDVVGNL